MNRFRTIFYGIGILVFAALIASAWTYLEGSSEGSAGTAGPISTGATLPAGEASGQASQDLGTPTSLDPGDYTRFDDSGGAVTVDAAVLTEGILTIDETLAPLMQQISSEELGIMLAFNTHSVDLSGYDPVANVSLETSAGVVSPARWITESDGSHHRSGVVVFSGDGIDLASAGELTLTLRDLDGVPERVMTWSLPLE